MRTRADVRRRSRTLVVDRKMPPWFADPHYGKFSNAMGLSASEIDTIVKWADGGAPEGDPRDLPKPAEWVEGWGIGTAGHGLRAAAALRRPGARRRRLSARHRADELHGRPLDPGGGNASHRAGRSCITSSRSSASRNRNGSAASRPASSSRRRRSAPDEETEAGALPSDFLVGYAPGQPAEILQPGQAKLIKAGSDIVFQMHYTPHGHARDRSHATRHRLRQGAAEGARPHAVGRQRHVQDSAG